MRLLRPTQTTTRSHLFARTPLLARGLLCAAMLSMGCATGARAPTIPQPTADDAAFAAAPTGTELSGVDPASDIGSDEIAAGDVLDVRVLGSTVADVAHAPVDRAGFVHLPLVGDVLVGGKRLADAERSVQTAYDRYDRYARVSLQMSEAKGHMATVLGAVERPGTVPLVGDARVADVLAACGGAKTVSSDDRLVGLADVDGARLLRGGVRVPIHVRRAMDGDLRHNVRIRPGDLLVVPPALNGRIIVLGHVQRPRTMPYREGMRLTEAVADAGGFLPDADSDDVRVVRGGYLHPKVYLASVRDIIHAKRTDVILAPGDVVFVSEHWFYQVTDVLEKIVPTAATSMVIGRLGK